MDILYLGSTKLHRSMDKGDTWSVISPDLTKGGKKGDVPYGTLTTISESILKFGLIYTGSDDGLVYVTKDGGVNWEEIGKSLPQNYWVSRVEASRFDEGRVYVSLNGYRWDNFESLVYRSDDYGKTWVKLGNNLPPEPVNVVREDPVNEDIVYVGTDHALYVSFDKGESFMGMNNNLPDAPVHDLVIHPRDKDIIVGTHGRSIYIADVEYIEALTPEVRGSGIKLLNTPEVRYSSSWGEKDWLWNEPSDPKVTFPLWLGEAGTLQFTLTSEKGDVLFDETKKV